MAEVIRMPLLSDTMTEGKIVKWNKKVGDKVKSDDVLADVETDKATMEVVGYADGTLLYVGVNEGDAAKVNDIIAIVGKEGEDYKKLLSGDSGGSAPKKEEAPAAKPAEPSAKPAAPAPKGPSVTPEQLGVTVIRMPLLSDTMTEGKIVHWNKKVGDKVKADDSLADVETDKATMEVVGYADGTLLHVGIKEGEAAKVNSVIAIVGKEGTDISGLLNSLDQPGGSDAKAEEAAPEAKAESKPAEETGSHESDNASENGRLKASPLAKRLAEEKGIDIKQVQGTGDGGRIIKRDVDSFVPSAKPAAASAAPAAKTAAVPAFAPGGKEGYTDTQNSQMRKVIAKRLSESMYSAPHFFLTMEINMDNAMAARKQWNEVSPVKISFQDLTIKACAMALRQHPAVNSSWMGDFVRTYQHIHVGSAIALPEGLIVPVIRFADQKSLSQIAAEAKDLYDKARNKKIQPNEFSGNTFTISNLGMMDIDEFTAIINPPDSAILAVGRIKEVVVKKGTGFDVTNVMKVTLSCDHRSVDGAVGAAFLQTVKKYLENPVIMLV
ncbi:pyruvate dehydrogenase complex dihydrolipoamide acetyltransferase [Pollutibacter soli]|uniref:pyruvate dehydrogenase complex dihydrolipoamide acetyltransferase n=1 Tax=Pollutibacter soli TaxID=3034157 RepID=UPI0030138B57